MARALVSAALLSLPLVFAGCPAGESARCRDLCQTVVTCIESLNQDEVVIDETECTITCTSLERDPEGKAKVDDYAACIRAATDCSAQLACTSPPAANNATPGENSSPSPAKPTAPDP